MQTRTLWWIKPFSIGEPRFTWLAAFCHQRRSENVWWGSQFLEDFGHSCIVSSLSACQDIPFTVVTSIYRLGVSVNVLGSLSSSAFRIHQPLPWHCFFSLLGSHCLPCIPWHIYFHLEEWMSPREKICTLEECWEFYLVHSSLFSAWQSPFCFSVILLGIVLYSVTDCRL